MPDELGLGGFLARSNKQQGKQECETQHLHRRLSCGIADSAELSTLWLHQSALKSALNPSAVQTRQVSPSPATRRDVFAIAATNVAWAMGPVSSSATAVAIVHQRGLRTFSRSDRPRGNPGDLLPLKQRCRRDVYLMMPLQLFRVVLT
jgi:hypothetical protein